MWLLLSLSSGRNRFSYETVSFKLNCQSYCAPLQPFLPKPTITANRIQKNETAYIFGSPTPWPGWLCESPHSACAAYDLVCAGHIDSCQGGCVTEVVSIRTQALATSGIANVFQAMPGFSSTTHRSLNQFRAAFQGRPNSKEAVLGERDARKQTLHQQLMARSWHGPGVESKLEHAVAVAELGAWEEGEVGRAECGTALWAEGRGEGRDASGYMLAVR